MAGPTTEVVAEDLKELTRTVATLRADFGELRGEIRNDLRWIKGIGVALLLTAFSFAGWAIADLATLKAEVRQQATRLDKLEARTDARFDALDKKLDTLIERTAPKKP
jgi:hypothetical protein